MPDETEIRAVLAQAEVLRRAGNHRQAKAVLQELLQQDPGNAQVHYRLGQVAANPGDLDACHQRLGRASAGAPGKAAMNELLERYGRECITVPHRINVTMLYGQRNV